MKLLFRLVLVVLLLAAAAGPGRTAAAFGYWWLTNDEPPSLSVEGLPPSVRGTVEVQVRMQPSDRSQVVRAAVDNEDLPPGLPLRLDTTRLADGPHTLVVRAEDASLHRNAASASVSFQSDNTPPSIEVELLPPRVAQGHTALIHIRGSEPVQATASLRGAPVQLVLDGSGGWAVLGIDPDEQPGRESLVVDARDAAGNAGHAEASLTVDSYEFTQDSLQFPPTMADLLSPAVRSDEDQRLRSFYRDDGGPPRWKGPFIQPVKGPITTEFGEVRSYNGRPYEGHHGGTDFAVGSGAPAIAGANGRVVFRDEVRLRGKVLILDHGGGVYTTYAHLSEWLVEEGQEIQGGQPVAKVGSSGLSTGPHLHWEMWVHGVNVDPMEWTSRAIP
ncbi:MAG: M23 family metallopeptidase [Chloroflexi bacterium]|nr:M23 family metallopeptidase [Chloroflexota bacterium]